MTGSTWGDESTRFFFELTPERVLDAVETSGLKLNGRCIALNSYENRVYELELEEDASNEHLPPVARRRVAKFYRPGRWTQTQIQEEHQFTQDLADAEVPVVTPVRFEDGETLHQTPAGIWYALYPKMGGRIPDELDEDQTRQLGRLLARIHVVGSTREAKHRLQISVESYGRAGLSFLLQGKWIPENFRDRYERAAQQVFRLGEKELAALPIQRIHGDCHRGNLLLGAQGLFFLDFDDMLSGPPLQDVWLLIPGRDLEDREQLRVMMEGYEEMRPFDRKSLRAVEILRALRFIHYTSWLAHRWSDPIFPKSFPHFNTEQYWNEKTRDLEEQVELIQEAVSG